MADWRDRLRGDPHPWLLDEANPGVRQRALRELLARAIDWLVGRQDAHGRWANDYTYAGKMVVDIDRPGRPSRWVTLRACRVLRAVT